MTILKNKLLFIHIWYFFVKCDIPLYGNSDLIVKFYVGENGVLHGPPTYYYEWVDGVKD